MTVSLDEAREFVSREAEKRNGKVIRRMPRVLAEATSRPHFYIFNVGPWAWSRQLGSNGTRLIPACPEGQKHSEALTVPILHNETVATDMNKMENTQEEGEVLVNAILMKGYGFKPENSLENWGVAVIEHWPPEEEDLAEPMKKLNAKCDELIFEADRFHDNREFNNITEMHRWAARRRKQQKGWLNANPDTVNCPACGSVVMPNIAVCPHCSATLNEKLARKFFPERFQKAS